jgi:FlgN protein
MTSPDHAHRHFSLLESVLVEQVGVHERMLALLAEHRAALQTADLTRLRQALDKHHPLAVRAQELEDQRRKVVRSLTGNPADEQRSLRSLLTFAPDSVRERLARIAESLKHLLERMANEQQALARASEVLSGHMQGVLRQVYSQFSDSGTYARSGVVETRAQVLSALDIHS